MLQFYIQRYLASALIGYEWFKRPFYLGIRTAMLEEELFQVLAKTVQHLLRVGIGTAQAPHLNRIIGSLHKLVFDQMRPDL